MLHGRRWHPGVPADRIRRHGGRETRLAERLAGALNELAGEPLVRSHHGSLARESRSEVEELLKAGRIRALVTIAGNPSPGSYTVTIDAGSAEGVSPDMAVISGRGVVGRVIQPVAPHAATVQLLTDRLAGVAVTFERTNTGGIVVGGVGDPPFRAEYVSPLADIQPGDTVVSSGQDGVYPQGFAVGTVDRVTKSGGGDWTKRMEGMKEVLMVVTLGMDPTRPAILYAGTSGGVYKTVNEGGHWEKVNNGLVPPDMIKSSRALNVTSVHVDPFEPDTVYAATLAGLFKTTDGANTWIRIGESLSDQMIIAMILDRSKKGVIFITGRDGVHRSTDGGVTWKTMNQGFATTNVRSIAQSATDPDVFYAGTNGSGLYRSRDAGETWEQMPPLTHNAAA